MIRKESKYFYSRSLYEYRILKIQLFDTVEVINKEVRMKGLFSSFDGAVHSEKDGIIGFKKVVIFNEKFFHVIEIDDIINRTKHELGFSKVLPTRMVLTEKKIWHNDMIQ